MGFAAGAIPGALLDFSFDCINDLRKKAKLDSAYINNDDIEFVIALLKLPDSVLTAEEKNRLHYNTTGMFKPANKPTAVPNPVAEALAPSHGL